MKWLIFLGIAALLFLAVFAWWKFVFWFHTKKRKWKIFKDFYSDPENIKKNRELTNDMLPAASLPEEWREDQ